ncbi:4'-phosphopantetheinyl transferase [Paracoccus gahaiensis]|uniref:4'-phosphopantetheinyl transferase n=1 Tax=Paracoccus gahaiensis TaxID=1706839 RepID=A0A4U0RUC3_9RHOB|nr:4'-phosphopantetheinyl transferase [Paracoccus gahaiensis]TJZ91994.1 4'-phosphopantetheinyl transferase [Paracoccus gahaiensis]
MIPAALHALLPDSVGAALRRIDAPAPPLWPGEAEGMARAIPARLQEFAAGRAAARDALQQAGLAPCSLPTGLDRAPLWPEGAVGSISHAGGWAAAVAARRDAWTGIGLDLEIAAPMPEDMAALVRAPGDDDGGLLPPALSATLVFSLKEAAFKAQFPLTGLWLEPRDVPLTLTPERFHLRVGGVALSGRWARAGAMFASVLLVGAEQGRQLGRLGMDVMARQGAGAGGEAHLA